MFYKLTNNKLLINVLIILVYIFFFSTGKAWGLSFHLPWTNYESYIITQGNGGTFSHQGKYYYAWDFAMPEGTIVRASAPGKVVKVVNSIPGFQARSWGNYIIIEHENGIYSRYAHLQLGSILLRPGMKVNQGQVIGRSGNTGNSTGPHLHYQVENKDGFSQPSSFVEVGVPITSQNVISQNNVKTSKQELRKIDYKRLYAILTSKEFEKNQSNFKNSNYSPSESYLKYSINNKKGNNEYTTIEEFSLEIKKVFSISRSYKILNTILVNLPFFNIINNNYYLIKVLVNYNSYFTF